ncbi:MAG: RNA polymerase sigma factor, partial [Planctomycetia bacterium]|nr:RNA polymerase sigma factor [Planctomycetia bacterium]
MSRYAEAVLAQIDRVFNRGTVAGLSEGGLLARFVAGSDEAAFTAIVARHGPMVLGVCRRILRDEHDVEDAFQATFLVLVRRAGSIRDGDLVGPWLHGVARRVAVRARANAARRHVREAARVDDVAAAPTGGHELRSILDEELDRLPGRMRAPLVLCYLDGLTHDEAASRLRWPVGTVRSRMARGRDLLRRRLSRRGVSADDAALASVLIPAKVPPGWLDLTVRASLQFMTQKSAAVAVTSGTAAALARGVLDAMMIAKLKVLGAAAVACVLTLGGARTFAQFGGISGTFPSDKLAPEKKAGDRPAAILRALNQVQSQLRKSVEQIADLEGEVKALRTELEAMKSSPPAALGEAPVPDRQGRGNPRDSQGSDRSARRTDKGVPARPKEAKPPSHTQIGQNSILVISPEGDRAAVHNLVSGETERVKLSDDKTTPHEVVPIVGPGIVALGVKGPRITRLAAYVENGGMRGYGAPMGMMMGMGNPPARPVDRRPANVGAGPGGSGMMSSMMGSGPKAAGGWYPVDLREPTDTAMPVVGAGTAVYVIGQRVYAFASKAGAWDVIEFPDGVKPSPIVGADGSARYENDGHIYTFDK